MMQIYQNDSKGAESSAIQALNFLKDVPEKFLMHEAYNIIAVASYNLGDFEKSLEYNTKALNLAKIHGGDLKENSISSSLNNIGVLYQKQNMYSKTIKNFKEALKCDGLNYSNLFILQKKTDPETIAKCISHISEIKSVEKEIRNITHDLHQDVFSAKNDYPELVRALATDLDETVEINSEVNLDENINWETVPALLKMHSYRILQESISNVVKHSNAKNLYVNISQNSENLVIEIKDDGKGFNTTQESSSLGLKNIKYRTTEMEGKFEIFSSEKGTSIILNLPLQ